METSKREIGPLAAKEELLRQYPGIERAIEDVRAFAERTGCEKAIQVQRGTGRWVIEVEGDQGAVRFPPRVAYPGCFLVHSHPNMPTELSTQDLICAYVQKADGVLAVCVDGTLSWSSGLSERALQALAVLCPLGFNPHSVLVRNRFAPYPLAWDDPRYCVIAHDTNRALLKEGSLKDYWLLEGPQLREVLRKWG